jgi:hypothetical protein
MRLFKECSVLLNIAPDACNAFVLLLLLLLLLLSPVTGAGGTNQPVEYAMQNPAVAMVTTTRRVLVLDSMSCPRRAFLLLVCIGAAVHLANVSMADG